jgi:hypothetical protein
MVVICFALVDAAAAAAILEDFIRFALFRVDEWVFFRLRRRSSIKLTSRGRSGWLEGRCLVGHPKNGASTATTDNEKSTNGIAFDRPAALMYMISFVHSWVTH